MAASAPARRIRVVWNPASGSKAGIPTNRTTADEMRAAMQRYGLGDELIESESEEDAQRLVREAVESGYDVVAGAGGDGTIGLIARELLGRETALGILPGGSAMNIARSLDIPRELEGAAEILAGGEVRSIDIGIATSETTGPVAFFEAGSVGISAAIFGEAQRIDDGEWRGLFSLFRAILQYRPRRMLLHLDDQVVRTRAMMVVVANGPYTGIGLAFAPHARLDDGRFDVRVYRHFSRWELLRHMVSILGGRRRYHPKVATYRSAAVRIESAHPLPARADAHDLGTTPVTFETHKAALRVVVPPGARALSNGSAQTDEERSQQNHEQGTQQSDQQEETR